MARVRGPGTPTKKGIPWDVCWTDADGRERSKRFYDETKARKECGRIEQQLERGENTDPRAGRKTFRAVAEDWMATRTRCKDNSLAVYRRQLDVYILPALGDRPIATITAADVGRFIRSLYTTNRGNPRRPGGIERIMFPLRSVLRYAFEEGYIPRNPARAVENPDIQTLGVDAFEGIALKPAEVAKLAIECQVFHEHGEVIVWFVALTGLRAGEVARLDLADLYLAEQWLTTRRTKSGGRSRRVDYSAALTARIGPYVAEHPRRREGSAPLFYGRDNHSRADPLRRFDPATFYKRVFKPAAKRVGLPTVRFHDLRHTAGSWWLEAGVSLETVSARLGHRDINFTRRTYIHQLHTRVAEDAAKVDQWLESQLGRNPGRRSRSSTSVARK